MQDIFTALSNYIPPKRLSRLIISRNFAYYVYQVLRVFRRFYWAGYKSMYEALNDTQQWNLLQYCPSYLYDYLEPVENLEQFILYCGPYISYESMQFALVSAIYLEDLELVRKIAKLIKFGGRSQVWSVWCRFWESSIFKESVEIISQYCPVVLSIMYGIPGIAEKYGYAIYNCAQMIQIIQLGCSDLVLDSLLIRTNVNYATLLLLRNGGRKFWESSLNSMRYIKVERHVYGFMTREEIKYFLSLKKYFCENDAQILEFLHSGRSSIIKSLDKNCDIFARCSENHCYEVVRFEYTPKQIIRQVRKNRRKFFWNIFRGIKLNMEDIVFDLRSKFKDRSSTSMAINWNILPKKLIISLMQEFPTTTNLATKFPEFVQIVSTWHTVDSKSFHIFLEKVNPNTLGFMELIKLELESIEFHPNKLRALRDFLPNLASAK